MEIIIKKTKDKDKIILDNIGNYLFLRLNFDINYFPVV